MSYKKFFDYLKANVRCENGTWHKNPDFNETSFPGRRHIAFDENLRFSRRARRQYFNPHIFVYPSKTTSFDNAEQVFRQKAVSAFHNLGNIFGYGFTFDNFFKWAGSRDNDGHLYGAIVNITVPISGFDFDRLSNDEKNAIVCAYQVLVDAETAIGIRNEDFNKKTRGVASTKGGNAFLSRNCGLKR